MTGVIFIFVSYLRTKQTHRPLETNHNSPKAPIGFASSTKLLEKNGNSLFIIRLLLNSSNVTLLNSRILSPSVPSKHGNGFYEGTTTGYGGLL